MSPDEERDFCTREWSRVNKDKTVAVVEWLMDLRQRARDEVELAWVQVADEYEAEIAELRARVEAQATALERFKDLYAAGVEIGRKLGARQA